MDDILGLASILFQLDALVLAPYLQCHGPRLWRVFVHDSNIILVFTWSWFRCFSGSGLGKFLGSSSRSGPGANTSFSWIPASTGSRFPQSPLLRCMFLEILGLCMCWILACYFWGSPLHRILVSINFGWICAHFPASLFPQGPCLCVVSVTVVAAFLHVLGFRRVQVTFSAGSRSVLPESGAISGHGVGIGFIESTSH